MFRGALGLWIGVLQVSLWVLVGFVGFYRVFTRDAIGLHGDSELFAGVCKGFHRVSSRL